MKGNERALRIRTTRLNICDRVGSFLFRASYLYDFEVSNSSFESDSCVKRQLRKGILRRHAPPTGLTIHHLTRKGENSPTRIAYYVDFRIGKVKNVGKFSEYCTLPVLSFRFFSVVVGAGGQSVDLVCPSWR